MNVTSEIKEIASQFLENVKPSGPENVMATCPFHVRADGSSERRPSFAMSLITGLWFCHSCQAKGNLYTFLRDVGLDRAQIELQYRFLIDEAKKNLPPTPDPTRPGEIFSTNPLPEGLLGIFDYCPIDLLQAGFTEHTLSTFGVGFDMQHVRATYPLRDLAGNLVGISGRSPRNDVYPKYKIYDKEYVSWGVPERLHFDKRTILWNAHMVYPEVYFQHTPEYVLVVEGFKACMWVWQAGIKNVVAMLGTYLSWEHQWILERLGAPVYLFLDNNEAGKIGVKKCAEKLRASLPVKVVEYPERLVDDEDAQPDSCTAEEVVQQFISAKGYIEWLWH